MNGPAPARLAGTRGSWVSSQALGPAVFAAVLALVAVVTAWGGRVTEGRRALEAADSAFKRGDRVEAIVFARAAAEARCPFCDGPELAFARLFMIAKDAETRGDDSVAVAAWRAVRAATLGASVLDTSSAQRQRADAEIARLEHRIDTAAAGAGGASFPAASEEKLRDALAMSSVPSGTVFGFLGLGGALFFYGAFRFARARAFQPTSLVFALIGGALAAAGVLLF